MLKCRADYITFASGARKDQDSPKAQTQSQEITDWIGYAYGHCVSEFGIQPSEFWAMTPAEYLVLWDYKYATAPEYAEQRKASELDEALIKNLDLLL